MRVPAGDTVVFELTLNLSFGILAPRDGGSNCITASSPRLSAWLLTLHYVHSEENPETQISFISI